MRNPLSPMATNHIHVDGFSGHDTSGAITRPSPLTRTNAQANALTLVRECACVPMRRIDVSAIYSDGDCELGLFNSRVDM